VAKGRWGEEIYPVAKLWADRCLRRGESLLAPAALAWRPEPAEDLYERYIVQADATKGPSFWDKLDKQLVDAPGETVLLAADIICVRDLAVADIGPTAKATGIERVLAHLEQPIEVPAVVATGFESGLARVGAGKAQIDLQIRFLIELARAWVGLTQEEHDRLLADPWAFRDYAASLPNQNPSQRAAVVHFLFPDVFEPIVSTDVKQRIVKAFSGIPRAATEQDLDRQLGSIRLALEPILGHDFHFYGSSAEPVWSGQPTDPSWIFARFALKARELENFDELEMDYKLELADRLAVARAALLSNDSEWLALLKRAFGEPNNLTSWRQHASFLDWCESEPDDAVSALRDIWELNGTGDARTGEFLAAVPDKAIPTPGARANILSYLLGALGPDGWVIYKPTPADRALALCGREQAETSDVLGRMDRFTHLLDELRIRVVGLGGPATTRLEVQGMAWIVVEGTIPEAWSAADRAALEEFRKGIGPDAGRDRPSLGTDVPIRAWLVRGANVDGENRVPTWIEEGYVSIGWSEMGELDATMTLDELRDAAKASYPDEPPGAWGASAGNLFRFFSRMAIGDLVVTVSADDVYVGRIASDLYNEAVLHAGRRRKVEWINPTAPFSRAEILKTYPSLHTRMRTRLTVTDLKEDAATVRVLVGMGGKTDAQFAGILPASDELAKALFVPKDWIQGDILDLLAAKRQLIFYGPPGTGKTYVAQRIAEHLARSGGDFELVQFHPSYSYEDFFEGFRPTQAVGDTGVLYALRDGPLKRIAQLATADPAHSYLLIVDEINRGNIPKIFGELLYLLEYRDGSINLQYSDEPFSLPPNLFVIGTMNTADRSIALVDAALRRRFFFVPFLPTEAPVQGVLRGWLQEQGHDQLPALLLDELNRRIAKDEVAIGPSYFMNGDVSQEGLRRVWRHAILPLLDEHYYGTKVDVHAELGFDACLAAVTTQPAEPAATNPGLNLTEITDEATAADPA
jgi:MoxR-like ATPase